MKRRCKDNQESEDNEYILCLKLESCKAEINHLNKRIKKLEQINADLRVDYVAKSEFMTTEHRCQIETIVTEINSKCNIKVDQLGLVISALKISQKKALGNSFHKDDFIGMSNRLAHIISRGLLNQSLECSRDPLDLVKLANLDIKEWIKCRARKYASVDSLNDLSNDDFITEVDPDSSPLIFFVSRILEHSLGNSCTQTMQNGYLGAIGCIKNKFIMPIYNVMCSLFGAIDDSFESPIGRLMAFETISNGNTEEVSRELSKAIPGGVTGKSFKNKLNFIIDAMDLDKIRMESCRDTIVSWDNNSVNRYKMGTVDLTLGDDKKRRETSVWTTNRAATVHIVGQDPIESDPALGPSYWKLVKDLNVSFVRDCFKSIDGNLNQTLPGQPSLLDHYLGAVSTVIIASSNHVNWQRSDEFGYRIPETAKSNISKSATKFRECSEKFDIHANKEFRRGVQTPEQNSPTPSTSNVEIIESNLPNVFVNPGRSECRLDLLRSFLKYGRVAGFVDNENIRRLFIIVITDRGAECIQALDPREGEFFDKALLLLGTWHVRFNILKLVLKIIQPRDISPLISLFGYKTTKSQLFMMQCGDEKVTEMFVKNLTIAMFIVLRIRSAEILHQADVSDDEILKCASTFSESCSTCSDYLALMFELLIPFSMLKKADEANNMDMFDAAIIKILPFLFSCGGKFYGPSLVEEIIRMHLRVPLPVLNHRRKFFSVHGSSWDQRHEEYNRVQQMLMPRNVAPNAHTVQMATIISNVRPAIHKTALQNLDLEGRVSSQRTYISQTEGIEEIVQWLLKSNFLVPRHNRFVSTFDGKARVEVHKTISCLLNKGREEVDKYVAKFVEGGGIPLAFTSENQLLTSFEDDDDLITAD